MNDMRLTMQETLRLMGSGDLQAATRAIQQGLRGEGPLARQPNAPTATATGAGCIEGTFRQVTDGHADGRHTPGAGTPSARQVDGGKRGAFGQHCYVGGTGRLNYKLFVPADRGPMAPALVVMLHGCTQSPDDFARGTRMNALAGERGCIVAYPEQAQGRNANRCWNWFQGNDRRRGPGEAALIADLTRHLIGAHGVDYRRVFVAGLSAGGAMAVALAGARPDLFAAVGVHSGLPSAVARDLPSAVAAMKQGGGGRAGAAPVFTTPVPAIVFHGDRDTTVHPRNGAAVVAQCLGTPVRDPDRGADGPGAATTEHGAGAGGRTYTRTTFRRPDGRVAAEQWVVHGGAHAWFGGDPAGSYADASGPDASFEMLRFFAECARTDSD
jgi:poly(hydroxyalkanoate) depolymerase family esterase